MGASYELSATVREKVGKGAARSVRRNGRFILPPWRLLPCKRFWYAPVRHWSVAAERKRRRCWRRRCARRRSRATRS